MGLFSGKCVSATRLDGVTAVITGANTGIGKFTAQDFFLRGAKVILACRNVDKGREAIEDIRNNCKNSTNVGSLVVAELDLSDLSSVRNCANTLLSTEEAINLLVNNAGVMCCPQGKTKDGFETHFGTNHLGHFLLTMLLLPRMVQSRPARIVNVSSAAHMRGHIDFADLNWEKREYSAIGAYGQSKLANILFTKEFAVRMNALGIDKMSAYSLHPGVVATELGRHLDDTYFQGLRWLWRNIAARAIKTPEQGAQTSIYCSVAAECADETGLYYADCRVKEPWSCAKNMDTAKELWDVSLKLVGLPDPLTNIIKM